MITVSIYRYNSSLHEEPRFQEYTLPSSSGMTVLDVIMYVQRNLDPTVAYRYECRQGICGTCGVMLNGKPVLSCSTKIDPKAKKITIEPLANFPVEKDLVVNIAPILERFKRVKPYLEQYQKVVLTRAEANKSKPFRKCIECGCCIAGSTTVSKNKDILDPMDLVKIARYVTDPREGFDRTSIAKKGGVKKYSEAEGKKLAEICPRGVPIDKALLLLKDSILNVKS